MAKPCSCIPHGPSSTLSSSTAQVLSPPRSPLTAPHPRWKHAHLTPHGSRSTRAGTSAFVDVHIKGFCNSVTIEGCTQVRVACDGVIESARASRSHTLELYFGGFAPPLALEQCSSVGVHMCTGTLIGLGIETKGCSDVLLYSSPTRNGVGISAREIMEMPPPKPALLPSTLSAKVSQSGCETTIALPAVSRGTVALRR